MTLAAALSAALVLGYITQRLSLSPIVGYLLAGIAVGPVTPGFVANKELADQLAEIGVILLMFGVGLHFHLKDLLSVRGVAIPGALGQSFVATVLGVIVGWAFEWPWQMGMLYGLTISVASTVVMLRGLADNNDLHTLTGRIAIGWLIVEDLFAVFVLVLLPVLFRPGAGDASEIANQLVIAVAKIAVLLGSVFVIGRRMIPWTLTQVSRTGSRELFTLSVLVLAIGIATLATKFFGVSPALGAFLAGMIVGQSDFSTRAASEALPMRDAFAVLFFVSVGMLFDPMILLQSPAVVAITLAIVMLCSPLTAFVIVQWLGYPLRVVITIALAVSQIGEFSFIFVSEAERLSILSHEVGQAIIAAALFSISVNPLVLKMAKVLEPRLRPVHKLISGGSRVFPAEDNAEAVKVLENDRAIVVGYGPVGRSLVRMLQENKIAPIVIEMNVDTVRRLKDEGIAAVYGDASHETTLRDAGIEHAMAFVLTSAGMHGGDEAIRMARAANPSIKVMARSSYLKETPLLLRAGAHVVFSSEGEIALTMTEYLLRYLGATEEQIDRQRERIRAELFAAPLAMEILTPPPPKHPH